VTLVENLERRFVSGAHEIDEPLVGAQPEQALWPADGRSVTCGQAGGAIHTLIVVRNAREGEKFASTSELRPKRCVVSDESPGKEGSEMKRVIATGAALALLALPAGAVAKPDKTDKTNAAKECKTERGSTSATREAFRVKYGTNKNGRNAFGKCVSRRAHDEEQEGVVAHKNASKECKAEAEELGAEAFAAKYGTNKNGKNAHGKCVSTKAKEHEAEADAQDQEQIEARKNAAKTCAAERKEIGREAFAEKYGTNKNKRNAFGKCVSKTAKAQQDGQPEPVETQS